MTAVFTSLLTDFGSLLGDSVMVVGVIAALAILALVAAMRSHERMSMAMAFRAMPSAMAYYGPNDRLAVWNLAYAERLAEMGITARKGLPHATVLSPVLAQGLSRREEAWLGERVGSTTAVGALEFPLHGGRWANVEFCPTKSGGKIVMLNDITALRNSQAAMKEERDRAEAATRTQSEFLANMSHEIRTPLNGVLGMVQVMEGDTLTPDQRRRLGVVRESGAALLHILNDILDLSKVQAGKFELDSAPFDVERLVEVVVAAFAGLAASKHIELRCEVAPAAVGFWIGDEQRLRQVISNLISNALKFSDRGAVTLSVDADAGGLIFNVRDRGVGITSDQLPRLFEKFMQADSSMTRRHGGTGLGLAICREFVLLMGGEITATSTLGEGSCFSVRVPLMRTAAPAPAAQDTASDHPHSTPGRPIRVLAAEDNMTNQIVLNAMLRAVDADLTLVENGREAVEAFASGDFDVILMDIQMPQMSGVDATGAIRAMEAASLRARTPILALTANVMTHQVAEYMAAGMDGCVAKPIDLKALIRAINDVLAPPQTHNHSAAA